MADHPSYHDVVVFVAGKPYVIFNNYAYLLTCTRLSGWQFWRTWEGNSQLLGGEYGDEDFRIEVKSVVICQSAPLDETDDPGSVHEKTPLPSPLTGDGSGA